jgi:hypothetical protein
LDHLCKCSPDDVTISRSSGEVEHRTSYGRERPSTARGLRHSLGSFCEDPARAASAPVGRDKEVDGTGGPRDVADAVQLQRISASEHGRLPDVDESRAAAVISGRRPVAEGHDSRQECPPRPTRPTPRVGGPFRDADLDERPHVHDARREQARDLVDRRPVSPATHARIIASQSAQQLC